MAKGKYEKWLESDNLTRIAAWARDGLSDKQIAHNMGVAYSTLRMWRDKYPALSAALRRGKEIVDIEVENALYKKAIGHKEKVAKTFKLKRVEYVDGRKVAECEELVVAYDEVYIPPDTTATLTWLKNRKIEAWRDKANEYQIEQLKLETARIELEGRRVDLQEKTSIFATDDSEGGGVIELAMVMDIPEEFKEN